MSHYCELLYNCLLKLYFTQENKHISKSKSKSNTKAFDYQGESAIYGDE